MSLTRSLTLLSGLLLVGQALAGPITYAGRRTEIKAGVIITGSATSVATFRSSRPHVWTQLDRDRAIKPAEWSFTNPVAETTMTSSANARWIGDPGLLAVGARVSKQDAAYWEVEIDRLSRKLINNYDVLFYPVNQNTLLSSSEREKLRNFVDEGGLLWIDYVGVPTTAEGYESLPLPIDIFNSTQFLTVDPLNPLVSTPNTMTTGELGDLFVRKNGAGTQAMRSFLSGTPVFLGLRGDSLRFNAVIGNSVDNFVAGVSKAGEGYYFVTTRDVSRSLGQGLNFANNPPTTAINDGFRTLQPNQTASDYVAAAKLLVNAISLRSNYESAFGGPRNTSTTSVELVAPLIRRSVTESITTPAVNLTNLVPNPRTTPAIFNNTIFMSVGTRLVALDADPGSDRDGDGDPDDGVDDQNGSPQDVLWISDDLGGTLSSPTAFEGVRLAGATVPAAGEVAVHVREPGSLTRIAFFRADFRNVTGNFDQLTPFASVSSGTAGEQPTLDPALQTQVSPPAAITVHEGLAYVADFSASPAPGSGRVWVINLADHTNVSSNGQWWRLEGAPRLGTPDGPPTVGYVPIADNSGGQDRVVYVPFAPGLGRQAGFVSIWAGAKGEAPVSVLRNGNVLSVTTRAAFQNLPIFVSSTPNLDSLGVRLSAVSTLTGRPISGCFANVTRNGSQFGQLDVTLSGIGQNASFIWAGPGQNVAIRVDYSIDWGLDGTRSPEQYIRGDVQFPDRVTGTRRIIGAIALTKNGTAFATVAPDDATFSGGSLFALREQGRGEFNMLYRWEAFDAFRWPTPINGAGTYANGVYDGSIIDYDGVLNLGGIGAALNRALTNQRLVTAPVVRGNSVFVGFNSTKRIFGAFDSPTSGILSFDAEPSARSVTIANLSVNTEVVQPDPGKSSTRPSTTNPPDQYNTLRNGNYVYEPVDIPTPNAAGKMTFNTVASTTRSKMRDALICNLPFVLRRQGAPDAILAPDLDVATSQFLAGNAQGNFNPLKWSMVINGLSLDTNLIAAGDILYFGGASFLPSIINGQFPPTQRGFLYAVNTRIAANDIRTPATPQPHMSTQVARTWEPYVVTLDFIAPDGITPSPYILWPNPFGIRSFDDLRIRYRAATLANEATVTSVAAGNGVLIAGAPNASYVYGRSDLLIADAGRVLRVDPSGFPVWALDSTFKAGREGNSGASSNEVRLSNPSRVIQAGNTDYWIVDTGNKRIVRVDATGKELRSITEMRLDPGFTPSGVSRNTDLKIGVPRDFVTFTTIKTAAQITQSGFSAPALGTRQLTGTDEYWIHYIIADSGNQRVIELVDRYEYDRTSGLVGRVVRIDDAQKDKELSSDVNTAIENQPALGVLLWQIRSDLTGKQFAYNSIDRVFERTGTVTTPVYVFGYGNREASKDSFGIASGAPTVDNAQGGGGFVVYGAKDGPTESVTEFYYNTDIPVNAFWNDLTQSFNSPAVPFASRQPQRISGLRSATISYIPLAGGGYELGVMVSDNSGIYELVKRGPRWEVNWMLDEQVFRALRQFGTGATTQLTAKNPLGFKPMYAKRLPSGEVMVVNGYVGEHRTAALGAIPTFGINPGDPYGGEIVILSGDQFSWTAPNLGFNSYTVQYELPPLTGTRELVSPVFGLKR